MERDSSKVSQLNQLSSELLDLKSLLDKPYVSLGQVANLLGVEYITCMGYVRSGKLHAVKVGGRWRVYEGPLKEFLVERGYMKAADDIAASQGP